MKKNRLSAILLIISMLLPALTACGGSGTEEVSAEKETRTADSYYAVEIGNMIFQVPDYYEKDDSDGSETVTLYAEKGETLSFITLTPFDVQSDEDDFSSNYETAVDEALDTIFNASDADDSKKTDSREFRTLEGLQASETDFVYHLVSDDVDIPLDGKLIMINNRDHNKVIMAYLMQSDNSEYDYADSFMTMINEAEVLQNNDDAAEEPDEPAEESAEPDTGDSALLSPEFKKTMDDYEAWFDHYCEVMEMYKEDPSDLELMSEVADLLTEEQEMLDQMEKMDQSDMNTAELAYYLEVTARIEKKLLETAY